jgi:hypothetical protein
VFEGEGVTALEGLEESRLLVDDVAVAVVVDRVADEGARDGPVGAARELDVAAVAVLVILARASKAKRRSA